MSTTTLDVAAVRARYSALDRRLAFFDGPGGTQCPDEVIDAISGYLRESNANIGAPYETSVRTVDLVDLAHERAGDFLGCSPGEVAFGQSMTAMNFLLTRTFARTLRPGDEIVYTALDHDANVSPWLEIAHDMDVTVRVAGLTDDLQRALVGGLDRLPGLALRGSLHGACGRRREALEDLGEPEAVQEPSHLA